MTHLTLRHARSTDAGKLGEILYRFEADTDWMPKTHCEAEAIAFCGTMIDRGWVTVAAADRVLGFLAREGEEICALYVHPDGQGQGVGKALLDHAKTCSNRLSLWTFAANTGAQRFYLREGFEEVRRTEGDNDEGLPDILYRWPASAPPKAPRAETASPEPASPEPASPEPASPETASPIAPVSETSGSENEAPETFTAKPQEPQR